MNKSLGKTCTASVCPVLSGNKYSIPEPPIYLFIVLTQFPGEIAVDHCLHNHGKTVCDPLCLCRASLGKPIETLYHSITKLWSGSNCFSSLSFFNSPGECCSWKTHTCLRTFCLMRLCHCTTDWMSPSPHLLCIVCGCPLPVHPFTHW